MVNIPIVKRVNSLPNEITYKSRKVTESSPPAALDNNPQSDRRVFANRRRRGQIKVTERRVKRDRRCSIDLIV